MDAALEVIKRPTEAVYTLPYSLRWWTLHILLRTGGRERGKGYAVEVHATEKGYRGTSMVNVVR